MEKTQLLEYICQRFLLPSDNPVFFKKKQKLILKAKFIQINYEYCFKIPHAFNFLFICSFVYCFILHISVKTVETKMHIIFFGCWK